MDTIKIAKGNTKMIAHRGLSGIESENTNAAFIAAGNRSYWGIETDLYRTADGHFVICHDSSPKRMSGDELDIEQSTYDTIRSIKLYETQRYKRVSDKKRNDLCIPNLEEYIDTCLRYEKHSVLELKSMFTEEEIGQIIALLSEKGQLDKTIFISFVYENLRKIRAVLPDQPCQFLISAPVDDALIEQLKEDRFGLDIVHTLVTKELIDKIHAIGQPFNAWICNKKSEVKQFIEWGADYITSDILE